MDLLIFRHLKNMCKDLLKNLAKIKSIVCCFLCLVSFSSYGQSNKIVSGDTAFWFKFQNKTCEKLKLQPLVSSNDNFHFRFWTDDQVVDIWTVDGKSFNGSLVSYVNSYTYNAKKKTSKPSRIISKQMFLDTLLARKAFNLTKQITKIPSDKYIKGWVQGFDGIEYTIETSTPATYNLRTYWTPEAQDSLLTEVKAIKHFLKNLDSLLDLSRKYKEFFAALKPGAYTSGAIVITKLTKKQSEYLKKTKPYRDYLESVADTLNHYLSDTLTKNLKKYGELKCYDEFILTFSTDNKLIKITTNDELADREDRKEYLECKRKIAAAFKLISIDFVHSQVGYQKKLDYYEGKVNIYY